jgi:hypothetical protein
MSQSNEFLVEAVQRGYYVNTNGKITSPNGEREVYYDKWGYPKFGIKYKGKVRCIFVHRLVAYLKYGNKIFESGIQVRHKNNNKLDYSQDNILIGTGSQNSLDNPVTLRIKTATIAAAKLRKFTDGEVAELRKLNKYGIGIRKLSKIYKVAKSTLSYIMQNKTYKV